MAFHEEGSTSPFPRKAKRFYSNTATDNAVTVTAPACPNMKHTFLGGYFGGLQCGRVRVYEGADDTLCVRAEYYTPTNETLCFKPNPVTGTYANTAMNVRLSAGYLTAGAVDAYIETT